MPAPENVAELRGGLERLPLAPGTDFARDFSLEAAAEPNQPLRVLREQVFVDARLVIEPLGVAGRHELDEVVVSLVGLGQQNQVVRRLTDIAALRQPAARRDVDLAAENRLHAPLFGVVVEDDRRKHVAVFGHRQCRHLQARRLVEQLVDAARAVEQGKLGVTMKVNEVLISHWIWGACLAEARTRRRLITRYYSGVPFSRTTISCVAVAFFVVARLRSRGDGGRHVSTRSEVERDPSRAAGVRAGIRRPLASTCRCKRNSSSR